VQKNVVIVVVSKSRAVCVGTEEIQLRSVRSSRRLAPRVFHGSSKGSRRVSRSSRFRATPRLASASGLILGIRPL
jgi:hypothetical protein